MDSLPDDVVQYILSNLSYVKDLASCNCVSNKWKYLMSYHKSLCFPRAIFNNLTGSQTPDSIVMQMVSSVSRLEELRVSCPFTGAGLASWLLIAGSSLKILELNMAYDPNKSKDSLPKLDCIRAARNLESLILWKMVMIPTPKWDVFQKLRNLEFVRVKLEDSVFLREALCVTPNLTRLRLCCCEGLSTICIELLELRYCRVTVYPRDSCSLTLRAPKIKYLMVDGCNWIRAHETNCLKFISIVDNDVLTMVDFGNLMALESLHVHVFRWRWDVLIKMLQLASEIKHLWIGEYGKVSPFPEIDFVDFFRSHPKLKYFNIGCRMLNALCKKKSLKNVDSSFVFPCLEEVVINWDLPLKAKKITRLIDSSVKYGKKLKKIMIRIDEGADNIFEEICRTLISTSSSCPSTPYRVFRHPTRELHVIPTHCG